MPDGNMVAFDVPLAQGPQKRKVNRTDYLEYRQQYAPLPARPEEYNYFSQAVTNSKTNSKYKIDDENQKGQLGVIPLRKAGGLFCWIGISCDRPANL